MGSLFGRPKAPKAADSAAGQDRFGIPFWLVGEFTTHFRTYFSGSSDFRVPPFLLRDAQVLAPSLHRLPQHGLGQREHRRASHRRINTWSLCFMLGMLC